MNKPNVNPLSPKPERHLINIIENTRGNHPNFALFLGAGASITSGVDSASEMVRAWRKQHYEQYGSEGETSEQHFGNCHWHNGPEEYSYLFQELYDQPSQRREYIETCLNGSSPSWGYIYLVNLIQKEIFNIVLTTNFDDLFNEACYLFSSSVRPMVCAHDSSITSLRVTSKRPKVIKLHGDFLFDNIKNTLSELETLEVNMRTKFKHIAAEHGMIFIGYNGNDRSVMDCMDALLRTESNFPQGVYWCVLKSEVDNLGHRLDALRRHPRVHIVEIDGFDEFFATLHDSLGLDLQREIADPYSNVTDKLNNLLESTGIASRTAHHVIENDIRRLGAKLKEAKTLDGRSITTVDIAASDGTVVQLPVPYNLLSQLSEREQKPDDAIMFMEKQLSKAPRMGDFLNAFKLVRRTGKTDASARFFATLQQHIGTFSESPGLLNEIALELIHMSEYDYAENLLSIASEAKDKSDEVADYIRMNIIQIGRHQGKELSGEEVIYLNALRQDPSEITRLGALVLLQETTEANDLLTKLAANNTLSRKTFNTWPISKLLTIEEPHEIELPGAVEELGPPADEAEAEQSSSTADEPT